MNMLICPNCRLPLYQSENSYRCENGHSFDIAKEGYVNLLLSKKVSGDNKDMVKARSSFLERGHYRKLAQSLAETVLGYNRKKEQTILDAGCGQGYYSQAFSEIPDRKIIGFDISKEAVRSAAKNARGLFFVASGADIPLSDQSCDVIINVFAPFFEKEFSRILNHNGKVLKVIPGVDHLWELKQAIYCHPYENEEKVPTTSKLTMHSRSYLKYQIKADSEDLRNLVMMTPYFYTTAPSDLDKLKNLASLDITVSFSILEYVKANQ